MEYAILEELLGCPVCKDMTMVTVAPPIYQCPKGHLICKNCISVLQNNLICPSCRIALPKQPIRSLFPEQISEYLRVRCKNKEGGCKALFKVGDIGGHLQECKFGGQAWCQLFYKPCTEKYPLQDFSSHCQLFHKGNYYKHPNSVKKQKIKQSPQSFQPFENILYDKPRILELTNGNIYILTTTINKDTKNINWRIYLRRGNSEFNFQKVPFEIRSSDCTVTWHLDPSEEELKRAKDQAFILLETKTCSLETLFDSDGSQYLQGAEVLSWDMSFNIPEKRNEDVKGSHESLGASQKVVHSNPNVKGAALEYWGSQQNVNKPVPKQDPKPNNTKQVTEEPPKWGEN